MRMSILDASFADGAFLQNDSRARGGSSGMDLKLVGASGFEPPTSWSRTTESKNPNASSGVA
jgi:hypothetical protein